jgi:hypothetical protein
MADEVKIKVVLDTKDAQAALNSLGVGSGAGGGTTGGPNAAGSLSAGGGGGGSGFGLGKLLGFGAGLLGASAIAAPLVSPTLGGIGDIIGERLGRYGAQAENMILGTLPGQARASEQARKSVEETFAFFAGNNGIPPQARANYEAQFARNAQKERGIQLFEMDKDNLFHLKGEQVQNQMQLVLGSIADGFRNLGETIKTMFKNHR